MESVEKLIHLYVHLSRNVPNENSRTARLIRSGDWHFAGRRLLEELGEAVQAFHGRHGNLSDRNPTLAELAAEKGIDKRLSDIVLETSQLSYWYLVFHMAKLSLREHPLKEHREKLLEPKNVVSALEKGGRSAATVDDHARQIKDNPTVETVYGFIGKLLAQADLPLDIFAELDLREMRQKPYLVDFI